MEGDSLDDAAGSTYRKGVSQFVNEDRSEGSTDPGHQARHPESGIKEEQAQDQEGGADSDPEAKQRKADH
jgi:hypothetical protein